MVRLVPKDAKFFDMFAQLAGNIVEGAHLDSLHVTVHIDAGRYHQDGAEPVDFQGAVDNSAALKGRRSLVDHDKVEGPLGEAASASKG